MTGAERSQLLAAFNGGFKLSAGAGGYMQEGHVISPLRPGLASLVIDRSGQARIGVWGRGLPAPGEAVYSVRQDLQPLVLNRRPTAASADWTLWGATLGGGAYVARSAIGQDAAGDLMYAASMSAVPADLAAALAGHGARIAMELDINPEWVQLDAAGIPGGALILAVHAALAGHRSGKIAVIVAGLLLLGGPPRYDHGAGYGAAMVLGPHPVYGAGAGQDGLPLVLAVAVTELWWRPQSSSARGRAAVIYVALSTCCGGGPG